MRVTKTEKIWLVVVTVLYILYNFPGLPAYDEPVPMLIHGGLTLIPLWIAVYVGMHKVYKVYKLRDSKTDSEGDK
ncbi:MAG: hypothetical protein KJ774_06205 [Firmicutes bacterium]|nr:hypothetical protein [Bacillota bacterium]